MGDDSSSNSSTTSMADDLRASRSPTNRTTILHPTKTPLFVEIVSGLVVGSLQVILFNSYDRALYLSMTRHRPFLDGRNWGAARDWHRGLWPNLTQRAVTYGLYFPIEQMWTRAILQENANDIQTLCAAPIAGCLTGATSAILTNPLAVLKFYQYCPERARQSLRADIKQLTSSGKSCATVWSRGAVVTLLRETVFGTIFTTLRVLLADVDNQFFVNVGAGCAATVCSGPLNYVRSRQYAHVCPHGSPPPRIRDVLQGLRFEWHKRGTYFMLIERLRIGWGSLRVGLGMGVGNMLYGVVVNRICQNNADSRTNR